MKNITAFLRALLQLVLLTALVLGMVWLFRATSRGVPAAPAGKPSKTPPVLPTSTPEAYPPPGETNPPLEATPPPTIEYIELTPGEFWPPTDTPLPTFTPFPSPTLRPGPADTPIPIAGPAMDAAGTIIFLSRQLEKTYTINSLEMDAAGEKKGEPARISTDLENLSYSGYPSPNGEKLALVNYFSSEIAGGYILNLTTGKLNRFDQFLYLSLFFNWFPDNRQILMRHDDGSLRLADPISGENQRIAAPAFARVDGAAASPDGKQVIYAFRETNFPPVEMWIVNADGRDARMLLEIPAVVTHMAWSPDGKKIAFHGEGWTVMDADGSNLRHLGNLGLPQCLDVPPSWSPDSRWLAVVITGLAEGFCTPWDESVFKDANVLLIDIENGKVQPILPDGSTGNIDPAWSPDGSQVAFVSNRSGSPELWAINIDGSNLRQLTQASRFIRFPDWRRP